MPQNVTLEVGIEEVKANPFMALLMSRKFWLMVMDVVVSLTTYFITKYAAPELGNDVLFVVGLLQPVFVTIIGAIAYEDGKNAMADAMASNNETLQG